MKKLPGTARSKMVSALSPHNTGLPKLHDTVPSRMSTKLEPARISQLLPGSQKITTDRNSRAPLSAKMHSLELLSDRAKTSTEFRKEGLLSQRDLRHLVHNGILRETWGKKGVGVSLKLTNKGAKQLADFKKATIDNSRLSRKSLVSLKTRLVT